MSILPINEIICGDSLEIMRKFPDKCIDLVLTDPPYGIGVGDMGFVTSGPIKVGNVRLTDYRNSSVDWDKAPLSKEFFEEIMRVSKNQVIFGGNFYANILPPSRCWVVWDKRVKNSLDGRDQADVELIWTSFDRPSRIIRYLWCGYLQGDNKNREKRYHPTQKPVEMLIPLLKMFSEENDIVLDPVLDPFLGVGSTALACKRLRRKYIGIEIDEKYYEIAKSRLGSFVYSDSEESVFD